MRFFSILFLLLFALGSELAAQNFNALLLEGFSVEELETMRTNDPAELAEMTAFAEKGFIFMDYPKEKKGALDPSTALKIDDVAKFNPLSFDLRPHDHARIYYPIVGQPGKMVAILPRTELNASAPQSK